MISEQQRVKNYIGKPVFEMTKLVLLNNYIYWIRTQRFVCQSNYFYCFSVRSFLLTVEKDDDRDHYVVYCSIIFSCLEKLKFLTSFIFFTIRWSRAHKMIHIRTFECSNQWMTRLKIQTSSRFDVVASSICCHHCCHCSKYYECTFNFRIPNEKKRHKWIWWTMWKTDKYVYCLIII